VLTNGKDKEVLLRLQAAVATTVLGSVREVSFAGLGWGDEDAALLAKALPMCAQLVSLDLVRNPFGGGDGAQRLAAALHDTPTLENVSGIPLKELRADSLTTLDLQRKNLGALEAMVLAGLLRSASASMTECNLRDNKLGVEGWTIVFNALRDSTTSKIATWNLSSEGLGPEIAKPLAEYISVTASVTELNLFNNTIKDEGVTAICEALRSNKETKLASLNIGANSIGPAGAKSVAAMVAVIASVTSVCAPPKLQPTRSR
jgi:hypothetical protein